MWNGIWTSWVSYCLNVAWSGSLTTWVDNCNVVVDWELYRLGLAGRTQLVKLPCTTVVV